MCVVLEAGVPGDGSGADSGSVQCPDPPPLPLQGVAPPAIRHLLFRGGLRRLPRPSLGLAQRRPQHCRGPGEGGQRDGQVTPLSLAVSVLASLVI